MLVKNGAKIVWADIDLNTRVITAETIERCITPKTRMIVVVHLYGYGAEMPAIMDLAQRHNLLVVEDAAQALGVEIKGQKTHKKSIFRLKMIETFFLRYSTPFLSIF